MKNSGKKKEVGKELEKDGVGLRKVRHVLFPIMVCSLAMDYFSYHGLMEVNWISSSISL